MEFRNTVNRWKSGIRYTDGYPVYGIPMDIRYTVYRWKSGIRYTNGYPVYGIPMEILNIPGNNISRLGQSLLAWDRFPVKQHTINKAQTQEKNKHAKMLFLGEKEGYRKVI